MPEDDPNVGALPLSHLRSCQFGEVSAEQIVEDGEVGHCLTPSLASDLFSLLRSARVSCRAQGGRIRYGILDFT